MALSQRETETLIDLVENKLSDMPIWDGDDRKTVVTLEKCLVKLNTMKDTPGVVVALNSGPRAPSVPRPTH
jgi:hypothetical protein